MALKESYEKYSAALSQDIDITLADFEIVDHFLSTTSFAEMADWAEERTVTHQLGDRAFRMVVDRPGDGDDSRAVIVTGEFGNGISPSHVARSRLTRDLVDPRATLVYQPNSTSTEDNLNFSKDERQKLHDANTTPLTDRIALAMEGVNKPENVTLYGPSQGATTALAYAALSSTPAAALGLVEVPNVVERTPLGIAHDFLGSAAQLKSVVLENYESDPSFLKEIQETLKIAGTLKYAIGLAKADNRALVDILRQGNALEQMRVILDKGGSIVHGHGTKSLVSPPKINKEIAARLWSEPRLLDVQIEGADHSISNAFAVNAAIVRTAHKLKQK
jgi:pimeloyl-ACP methyl ester carboxylesterase